MTVTPARRNINASQTGLFTLKFTTAGGFLQPVNVSFPGGPPGSAPQLSSSVITGDGSVVLTVPTTLNSGPGSYPIVITASGGGIIRTATVTLSIRAFTLAAAPTTVSVARGATRAITATVTTQNGFASTVVFRVTGLPPGVKAVVDPYV